MSVLFSFKEGIKGFRRARLATSISITSIAITLLLVGVFALIILNVDNWVSDKRARIEIEVFFDADIGGSAGRQISDQIARLTGVAGTRFISKDEAAKRFEREFGRNVYDVLEANPLPASCTVKIKPAFQNSRQVQAIVAEIKRLDGVSDIVYEKQMLALIDRYLKIIYLIAGSVGIILLLVSTVLLYNTIRLTIYARRDIIEIMKLVGATDSFIKRPFVIEGFLQGGLGAGIGGGLLYLIILLLQKYVYPYLVHDWRIYAVLLIFGVLIGLISSRMSVSNHLARML